MQIRAIDKKIATCLVEGKAKKLSQRDEVVMDNGTAVYILWYTWIVMRKPNGELVWNTGNFPFSGTRTTKSRYKYLPAAIEWARGIAQI